MVEVVVMCADQIEISYVNKRILRTEIEYKTIGILFIVRVESMFVGREKKWLRCM